MLIRQWDRIVADRRFTEGPVWMSDGSGPVGVAGPVLLFSDLHDDRIWLHSERGLLLHRHPSRGANGNALDPDGNVVTCEHETRVVSRTTPGGHRSIVADSFEGRRLNSPNDVTIRSDGVVYFTDPPYGVTDHERELSMQGLFKVRADGALELLADDLVKPNGVALSCDESVLYAADTETGNLWSFELDGSGSAGRRRHVATVPRPDGLVVDPDGRLIAACLDGVRIIDGPSSVTIELPERPANLTIGGDRVTLFVCARQSVYRLRIH